MKKLLFVLLFAPLLLINCNPKKQKDSNSNISEEQSPDNQETKKELTASDIYNSSKDKVVLLMTYDKSYPNY